MQTSKFKFAGFKCIALLISATLLLLGWTNTNLNFSIAGATLYLLVLIGGLISVYIGSKKFVGSELSNSNQPSDVLTKVSTYIEGVILLFGLVATLFDKNIFKIPGMIIWVGTIVIWVLGGFVISSIAKIPVKMTYGGWKIKYPKK